MKVTGLGVVQPRVSDGAAPVEPLTVLSELGVSEVGARWIGEHPVVSAEDLVTAIGWADRPHGLCRGDRCVPVADRSRMETGNGLDLVGVAEALGSEVVIDRDRGLMAISAPASSRAEALRNRRLPELTLPDLFGVPTSLETFVGNKHLLVAFASW